MYPGPASYVVEEEATLREFLAELGHQILYAYENRALGVLVNGERRWASWRLQPGDRVTPVSYTHLTLPTN